MLDVTVIVYLDNILIYSDNLEDHKKHVREVLHHLRKHGLYTKPEKCEFHTDTTEYLGYCLSPAGLTMAQNKVNIIHDWPEPQKVRDIQSFLSFTNFYHRFIYNYSDIVVEMTLRPTNKRTVEESLVSKQLMDSEWGARSRTRRLRAKTQRELE